MATQIDTWEIVDGKLERTRASLADGNHTEPGDLEDWISSYPELLGGGVAIIGRQVTTSTGFLDLLGIDQSGNTVVVELKRDKLPREVLAQAIDYASDVASWSIDYLGELCVNYTGQPLEDVLASAFPSVSIESLSLNQEQRILVVGFRIDEALERMIAWLSDRYAVSINAVVLNYVKTKGGDELLLKTTIIPEEVAQARTNRRKFKIAMSDEPGEYSEDELKQKLIDYLSQPLYSARRIRNVLLPACLEKGALTREQIKQEMVDRGEPQAEGYAGQFMSLISSQIGKTKNDFLRQVIAYEYPNYEWEKDNYRIRQGYEPVVSEVLERVAVQ